MKWNAVAPPRWTQILGNWQIPYLLTRDRSKRLGSKRKSEDWKTGPRSELARGLRVNYSIG